MRATRLGWTFGGPTTNLGQLSLAILGGAFCGDALGNLLQHRQAHIDRPGRLEGGKPCDARGRRGMSKVLQVAVGEES